MRPRRALAAQPAAHDLAEASALLTSAHAALRAGSLAEVDALLGQLARSPAAPVLAQEREVVAIELLAQRGERERAAARARAFVDAHPTSPYTATLAPLLR